MDVIGVFTCIFFVLLARETMTIRKGEIQGLVGMIEKRNKFCVQIKFKSRNPLSTSTYLHGVCIYMQYMRIYCPSQIYAIYVHILL